jgi:Ser/Thr protein kinase RdoA (MazF antagonist)
VSDAVPYEHLTPDVIIDSVEGCGFECTGSILGLASYENRVYQIGVTDGFVVAKFYRPGRWSTDAILEEHEFALELAEQDIPVVAPLVRDGYSLREHEGYRFAVYERRGGRWPELGTSEDREWLGRFLGRIHAVGATRRFDERPTLDREERVTEQLMDAVEQCFDEVGGYRELRIHGDCHRNNVLWTDEGPHFVDLDDCMNGPAVQDLWLFLAGSRDEMAAQLGDLLEGYGKFVDFDYRELKLIEALRALRLIHYTAWITRRWDDPAFPRAFPWLGEARYWEEHVQALLEQRAALDEEPLAVLV